MKKLAIVGLVALVGCRGKVLGTAALSGPGTATTHVQALGKTEVWADTDIKWAGGSSSKPELDYDLELSQGGKSIGRIKCSTERGGTSVCGSTTNIMGEHSGDCEYLLPCEFPSVSGDIEVKVTGRTGGNVKSVKKMSLNFRSK